MRNNKGDNVTQQKIIESASNLFIKNGLKSTTIKQIALNAGFKHTVIYYYFKNKHEIAREIYYTELQDILKRSYDVFKERKLSPTANLINLSYNIHTAILENPLMNNIFFERRDYQSYEKIKLQIIVENFIYQTKHFINHEMLDFNENNVLAALIIWESSAKTVLAHIKKGMLGLNEVDGIMLLTKNLYCNAGFCNSVIDEAIKEFKEFKEL